MGRGACGVAVGGNDDGDPVLRIDVVDDAARASVRAWLDTACPDASVVDRVRIAVVRDAAPPFHALS